MRSLSALLHPGSRIWPSVYTDFRLTVQRNGHSESLWARRTTVLIDKGINTFLNSTYTISNEYDRMGCRMEGDVIEHKNGGDIITDGISFGAVQVPSHGNPIVMMADHQTTGGYTKIANVISVDLPVLAQCMPGMKIHFEKVTVDEAQALYCKEKKSLTRLLRD